MAQSASSVRNASVEQRRAATGYLVWPLAFAEIIRDGDGDANWTRVHARQALVFGLLASMAAIVVLALPLVTVIAIPAISTGTTIAVYAGGLIADVLAAVAFVVFAVRFSTRAARGEVFAIPLVTPIVERVFRSRRP